MALQFSLLKLAKLVNPLIATLGVKMVYIKIALLLSDLGFAYGINKERRNLSVCDLHWLVKL